MIIELLSARWGLDIDRIDNEDCLQGHSLPDFRNYHLRWKRWVSGVVIRAVNRLLKQGQLTPIVSVEPVPVPHLPVATATWLLLHEDERLDEEQRKLRVTLCQISPNRGTG